MQQHDPTEVRNVQHHDAKSLADQEGAALVVGLVGSVTQRLLHVAPCPVLAVPPVRQAKREETRETVHAVG